MHVAGVSVFETQATGLAAAAAAALIVLVPGARLWRGRRERTPSWCAPLALSLAACAAFVTTRGFPSLPPREALQWLPPIALLGALFGAWEARAGRWAAPARAMLAGLLPVLLLDFQRRNHWGAVEGVAWTAGLAAGVLLAWNALRAHAARFPLAWSTLGLSLASAIAAGTAAVAGGGLFFVLPAALALASGACALVGLLRGEHGLASSGLAPFVLLHFGFLFCARYLYELSAVGFALLALAPLAVWVAALAPPGRPRTRAALALSAPVLVALAALAHELAVAPPSSPY